MKCKTHYLVFNTKKRVEFINITSQVRSVIKESQVKEGLCLVNAMHISASVSMSEVHKCACF